MNKYKKLILGLSTGYSSQGSSVVQITTQLQLNNIIGFDASNNNFFINNGNDQFFSRQAGAFNTTTASGPANRGEYQVVNINDSNFVFGLDSSPSRFLSAGSSFGQDKNIMHNSTGFIFPALNFKLFHDQISNVIYMQAVGNDNKFISQFRNNLKVLINSVEFNIGVRFIQV